MKSSNPQQKQFLDKFKKRKSFGFDKSNLPLKTNRSFSFTNSRTLQMYSGKRGK